MLLADRGVYMPPVLDESGFRYLIAVNSQHRVICQQRVFSEAEVSGVTAMLQRYLEQVDPIKTAA